MSKQSICLQGFFLVNLPGDRILFDLYLPQDEGHITGIYISASLGPANTAFLQAAPWSYSHAGLISFRWHDRGDIFYQATVDLSKNYEESYSPLGLVSPAGSLGQQSDLSISGRKISPLNTPVPSNHRHLQGYYKDTLGNVSSTGEAYAVYYFIQYQVKS